MNHPPHESVDYSDASVTASCYAKLDHLWQPLRQAICERRIPSAVAAVSCNGQTFHYAGGWAVDTAELRIAATQRTLYDCASLTKVAVTLPLIVILIQQGKIKLDDSVANYIPELRHPSHRFITIRHLLTHTSGLPAEIDCYSYHYTMMEAIQQIGKLELAYAPGSARIYSDPGFILLGWLFQQVSGMTLMEGAQQLLWQPLHMNESLFCPPPTLRSSIAATEYDTASQSWLHGIVHDENARQLGGIAGHAGLFATARDLLLYGQSWLAAVSEDVPQQRCAWLEHTATALLPTNPSIDSVCRQYGLSTKPASNQNDDSPNRIQPSRTPTQPIQLTQQSTIDLLRSAIASQTPPLPGVHRGLGWVLHGDEADVSGGLLSPAAFGHTGFTGTSLYIDPQQQLVIVLLTNRVHYGRQQSIQQVRRDFHSAVATYANANRLR